METCISCVFHCSLRSLCYVAASTFEVVIATTVTWHEGILCIREVALWWVEASLIPKHLPCPRVLVRTLHVHSYIH